MLNRFLSRFWFLVAFVLYLPIYLLPLPPQLVTRGIAVTDELLLILFCALIYVAFVRDGWMWKALGLAATLILFTLPLLRVWKTAASGNNMVLGLMPFIDAQGFYSDSLRLMAGRLFENTGTYRPLFSVFLATLLKLGNGNLQMSVAILAIIFALGVFSLAAEARNAFGAWAGVALIVFLQFFYRQFVGATMTEQLGVPLGAFGLTALLQAMRKNNLWYFLAGLFLLSFALLVRSGAYFVLPALMLFGWVRFTKDKKSFFINAFLLFIAVALPWGIDSLVRSRVAPPDAVVSGNFAFHLYGQARGGEGWRDIYREHPELKGLPMAEVGRVAYQYAFEEIKKNPFGLVQGAVTSLGKFFSPIYLFDVFQTRNPIINFILQILSFILFLAGLWFVWKKRAIPTYALLLACLAGILLSVPFVPPWDGGPWWGGIRIHSATLGVHLLITGIGLAGLLRLIPARLIPSPKETAAENGSLFWILGFTLAVIVLIAPSVIQSTVMTPEPRTLTCANGEIQAKFPLSTGAFLEIAANNSGLRTNVPIVLVKDLNQSLVGFNYGEVSYILRRINQEAVFLVTNDLVTGTPMWVIGPPALANSAGRTITACGKLNQVPVNNLPNVFYVNSFQ
jgi:hypothetical protein